MDCYYVNVLCALCYSESFVFHIDYATFWCLIAIMTIWLKLCGFFRDWSPYVFFRRQLYIYI